MFIANLVLWEDVCVISESPSGLLPVLSHHPLAVLIVELGLEALEGKAVGLNQPEHEKLSNLQNAKVCFFAFTTKNISGCCCCCCCCC